MDGVRLGAAALAAGAVLAFAWWLRRRAARSNPLPARRVAPVIVGGMLGSLAAYLLQRWILQFADLSLVAERGSEGTAALSMLLVVTPLEEALKVLVVWPLYLSRRLQNGVLGATYAVLAAVGFAAGEILVLTLLDEHTWLQLLRTILAVPAHVFFAGVWGYTLGSWKRDRYFTLTWLGATAVHGLYDHIVFGRGPALLVVAIPMFATMAFFVFAILKNKPGGAAGPSSGYSLFEPTSISSVGQALARKGRPLVVHWIVLGAFVNLGVTLVFLGTAVYLGHRYGVDFALADEEGAEGIVPIALLGGALLAAFPVSAYLIARASGTSSVLEPAWATGAAIVVVLFVFSVTEPTALVLAAGIAPVGFLLACAGAWFGLPRR